MKKVFWKALLSDNRYYLEEEDFKTVVGEPSPYNKLLQYIKENNLSIVGLSLFTEDGRTFNLPSLKGNPKFSDFYNTGEPARYSLERKVYSDLKGESGAFTTACVWYGLDGNISLKLSIWVDDNNTSNCWSLATLEENV